MPPEKILVVDDSREMRDLMINYILRPNGYDPLVAENGLAGLELARQSAPDVIVADMKMPEMSGLEVQARLRRISPSTRVIVLTARDDPSVRRMAINAGASAFFVKGVESNEFLAGVKATADSIN